MSSSGNNSNNDINLRNNNNNNNNSNNNNNNFGGSTNGFNGFNMNMEGTYGISSSPSNAMTSPTSSPPSTISTPVTGLLNSIKTEKDAALLPFVRKTFEILHDPASARIISWSESGSSFVVWDTTEFARCVLPKYFKHKNFCSFVRQLNTYGFSKADTKLWEFHHERFHRDHPEWLVKIQRRKPKKASSKSSASTSSSSSFHSGSRVGSADRYGSPVADANLVNELNRLQGQVSQAESISKIAQSEAASTRAQLDNAQSQLASYKLLASNLLSEMSAGRVNFANPSAQSTMMDSLVSLILTSPAPTQFPSPATASPALSAPISIPNQSESLHLSSPKLVASSPLSAPTFSPASSPNPSISALTGSPSAQFAPSSPVFSDLSETDLSSFFTPSIKMEPSDLAEASGYVMNMGLGLYQA